MLALVAPAVLTSCLLAVRPIAVFAGTESFVALFIHVPATPCVVIAEPRSDLVRSARHHAAVIVVTVAIPSSSVIALAIVESRASFPVVPLPLSHVFPPLGVCDPSATDAPTGGPGAGVTPPMALLIGGYNLRMQSMVLTRCGA